MKSVSKTILIFCCFIIAGSLSCSQQHQSQTELNKNEFKKSPREHYPETWFHFIGGNVSKEGITADLEAIAAAGLSGIQLFYG
jgi:hypothetical protein